MEERNRLGLVDISRVPLEGGQEGITIETSDGDVQGILHPATGFSGVAGKSAAIWVCGAAGGLDGPSFGIYVDLAREIATHGVASLRLDYRSPGDLSMCVLDVLLANTFLIQEGIKRVALVGHSFGGAVVIMAGVLSRTVRAVVGLSSQTAGAQRVGELAPIPLLLVHGERDRRLSPDCSRQIYDWAGEPKELVIYPDNGHSLRECHEELFTLLKKWLLVKLRYDR